MSIQRVPEVPFAQISNAALRDTRLSFKARGVLALVLSHSGDWEAKRDWLVNQSQRDGRHAVQEALNELTDLGYRTVTKTQDPKTGTFMNIVVWRHEPEVPIIRPTENPTVGLSDRRKTGRSLEHNQLEHNQLENNKDDLFDDFWEIFPRKAAKIAALRAWKKAVTVEKPEKIIEGALRYRSDPHRQEQFTAHASTWLNQGRWDDEPLPGPLSKAKTGTGAYLEAAGALSTASPWPLGELEGR